MVKRSLTQPYGQYDWGRVPDLGGSFCDIWLVGAYVRAQASLIFINIQS
jgi:hypothetical protein